ncbi:alpha/beta fold hydrolase [Oricola thermophila]|uniref:Alpha/beta hydrolase n=1 Tax=Oricola thermophila TaxID=2742145 RepID=A0A6N1VB64_9HYPH|nr:alpha/beta hydrolase [Oricola thermophila]QKV18271.1 alpha/beta hydrolase [Oricola thermophila]
MESEFWSLKQNKVAGDGVDLNYRCCGEGPPLVFLHGYPQTHVTWHRVAAEFARDFTCYFFDLRGYGDSSIPPAGDGHFAYSKRSMAKDIVLAMKRLGYRRFAILGHDRGARVAYRMALDWPDTVSKLGIVEIIPTGDMWDGLDASMALKAYHWSFLAQPSPLPERMISGDPEMYLDWTLASWSRGRSLDVFDARALNEYRRQFADPHRVEAMCEDYRAGATIDRELDQADKDSHCRIEAPVFFIYSDIGFPANAGDPLALWRQWATTVDGGMVKSGHFPQEEAPEELIRHLRPFFLSG